jgi:heme-degrading monooxygenase HmoA
MIAPTPKPPYYAVIFTSLKSFDADNEYNEMSDRMVELAKQQEGYLGHESARNETGITVSYWNSLTAIKDWKQNTEHLLAQQYGRERWYDEYKVRICLVERDYEFHHTYKNELFKQMIKPD